MVSTQTFTKESINKLDIISTFNDLMAASTGKDSIYIKTKETLQAIFDNGSFTQRERAEIISSTLGQITSSITNTAMQMAHVVVKDDRELPYTLAKLVSDTKLTQEQADKLSEDKDLIEAQKKKMTIDGWKIQADMYSKNGISVTAQSITNAMLNTVSQTNPLSADVVQGEIGKAQKFSTLNSAFRKDGVHTWAVDASKDIIMGTNATPTGWTPLTDAQAKVAIRQEVAFDDNKVQHAANSSANMIGLLLSSENYTVLTPEDVNLWRDAVDYLNTPVIP